MIPEVHLTTDNEVSRFNDRRAHKLNEDFKPIYNNSPKSLLTIIDWLDVENSKRYLPIRGTTFCNIYAYDYATLCGAYIPRVWWKHPKRVNKDTKPEYGDNIREMNVNSLYRWFPEFGNMFGWVKVNTLSKAQDYANKGMCVVILAANKDSSRSGHITCVIPEHGEYQAKRVKGIITQANGGAPIQSQAGIRNKKKFSSVWWSNLEKPIVYANISTNING